MGWMIYELAEYFAGKKWAKAMDKKFTVLEKRVTELEKLLKDHIPKSTKTER